jgi:hypothetical protein
MRNAAHYTYLLHAWGVVLVFDWTTGVSVTNAAEDVVRHLAGLYDLSRVRIIYRDSERVWDGIAVVDGRFAGFVPLRKDTLNDALVAAVSPETWQGV